ncbi:MAG: hypothetical protein ACYTG2_10285 [Planctomycetota bacterium]|jgi:hypothetical protein
MVGVTQRHTSRWLPITAALGLLALLVWLWLPATATLLGLVRDRPAGTAQDAESVTQLPAPRDADGTPALPEAGADAVTPLAPAEQDEDALGDVLLERSVLVSAVAPDGRPLETALREDHEVLWRETHEGAPPSLAPFGRVLGVIATEHPPPPLFASNILDLPPREAIGGFSRNPRLPHDERPTGCLGELTLAEGEPAWVSLVLRHVVLATEYVTPDETHAWFEVDPGDILARFGAVRLRIVAAEDGHPLEHARVFADLSDLWGITGRSSQGPDADGWILIDLLSPGATALVVADEGRQHRLLKVVVPAGRGLDLGEVALAQEVVLEGWAVDADGHPLTGRFGALPLPHETAADMLDVFVAMYRGAVTDEVGGFTLRNLGPERYLVVFIAEDDQKVTRSGWQIVDLRGEDAPRSVELRCAPATLVEFTVRGPRGSGPFFSLVRESDGLRVDIHGRLLAETRHWDVPQGRYRLLVHGRGGHTRERFLDVGPARMVVPLDR